MRMSTGTHAGDRVDVTPPDQKVTRRPLVTLPAFAREHDLNTTVRYESSYPQPPLPYDRPANP